VTEVFNPDKVNRAVDVFEEASLTPVEALLASHRLFQNSLRAFRAGAGDFRDVAGEEATHAFATQELNEIIYDMQDCIPVAVRLYNSLLREKGQKSSEAPE
jgi:hypothetical protein